MRERDPFRDYRLTLSPITGVDQREREEGESQTSLEFKPIEVRKGGKDKEKERLQGG